MAQESASVIVGTVVRADAVRLRASRNRGFTSSPTRQPGRISNDQDFQGESASPGSGEGALRSQLDGTPAMSNSVGCYQSRRWLKKMPVREGVQPTGLSDIQGYRAREMNSRRYRRQDSGQDAVHHRCEPAGHADRDCVHPPRFGGDRVRPDRRARLPLRPDSRRRSLRGPLPAPVPGLAGQALRRLTITARPAHWDESP